MATIAKPKHREARALYLRYLDLHPGRTVHTDLDPLEAGIVGDTRHGSGYHISREDNEPDDYSVDESPRDRRGRSDYASAMDIGYFKIKTPRGTYDLYDYNRWLIALCRKSDPDTADLREVIYSLDGKTVKRWDRLGRRSSGDSSHTWHTHLSEHRDADGHRMVNLARRWLQHIGAIETEDDMPLTDADVEKILRYDPNQKGKGVASPYPDAKNPTIAVGTALTNTLAAVERIDDKVDALAAKVADLAGRPAPGTVVITDEQLERVLRRVLGELDGATPPTQPRQE